jgi:hypothetical protein
VVPTLEPWIAIVRPRLPERLAGEAALARLGRAARSFAGDGLGALELRLGAAGSAGVVDLAFHVQTAAQARAIAPRLAPAHLRRFLASWACGEHPEALSLWLELDLDSEPPRRPVPGLCAALAPGLEPGRWIGGLLPALRGRPLGPEARRSLDRCLAALPRPGHLLYAASMESRGDEAVRLVVAGLDLPALLSYLGRVAPAAVARRAAEAAPLAAGAARTHLSFDVGEEVGERIGIECSFPRLPSREPGWGALLARWAAAGLAAAEEREALLAWTGYDSAWTAAPRWPAGAATAGLFCVRCLSHLKLVVAPERPLAAKAYLLFGPLRSERARQASATVARRGAEGLPLR